MGLEVVRLGGDRGIVQGVFPHCLCDRALLRKFIGELLCSLHKGAQSHWNYLVGGSVYPDDAGIPNASAKWSIAQSLPSSLDVLE